jgi:hypothetical protein
MAGVTQLGIRSAVGRIAWEAQRARRAAAHRLGWPGLMAALAVAFMLAALWAREAQRDRWIIARNATADRPVGLPTEPTTAAPNARARLREFEDHLLAHEDIPVALRNLITLAAANGLILERGAYRPQSDIQGGYLRYRMTLPLTGHADAILRFAMAALKAHPTLSLENVQFNRERGDDTVVEARIQWALLTRLPPAAAPRVVAGPTP